MEKDVNNWLTLSDKDICVARDMYKCGHYVYVLFLCQQSIEKLLKALIAQNTNNMPPRIHDLERLSIMADAKPEPEQLEFLRVINGYYMESRYAQEIEMLQVEIDQKISNSYLQNTEEVLKWLRPKLK